MLKMTASIVSGTRDGFEDTRAAGGRNSRCMRVGSTEACEWPSFPAPVVVSVVESHSYLGPTAVAEPEAQLRHACRVVWAPRRATPLVPVIQTDVGRAVADSLASPFAHHHLSAHPAGARLMLVLGLTRIPEEDIRVASLCVERVPDLQTRTSWACRRRRADEAKA